MPCCGVTIEAHRNADKRITYTPGRRYSFAGFTALMQVRDGESILLSVSMDATANGSVFAIVDDSLVLTIEQQDILSLALSIDQRILSYDIVISQAGFDDWFVGGDFVVLGLNDVACESSSVVTVELGGQCVDVTIEGGNIGAGASVLLADLNAAVESASDSADEAALDAQQAEASQVAAQQAATDAQAAAASIPGMLADRALTDGSNAIPADFRTSIDAVARDGSDADSSLFRDNISAVEYQSGRRKNPFGLTGMRMIRDDYTSHLGFNSCILDASNGKWVFVYRESTYHGVTDGALIVAEDSYDQGVTRVNRRTIFTDPAYDTRNFVPFHGANGRIGIIASRRTLTGGDSYGPGVFIYSDDDGETWPTVAIPIIEAGHGYNFNGAVLPMPASIGGNDTLGFMTYSYEGGQTDRVYTLDNGAAWTVNHDICPVDARFTSNSESVQWCVGPNKYVMVMRTAEASGPPYYYCGYKSTDGLAWTGPYDTTLVMNAVGSQGNPPAQINEPDADGTIHLIGFSRGGREIILGLRDWMLSASVNGEDLFDADLDFSALGVDWQPITPLPSWAAASMQTTKINGKWFGTLNVGEDYWDHTTSGIAMVGDFSPSTADSSRFDRSLALKSIPLVFRAHRNGVNQVVPSATSTDIVFTTAAINTGFSFNAATGEVTFPESGYYEVEAVLRFTSGIVAGQNNISYISHITVSGTSTNEVFDVNVSPYTFTTLRSRVTALFLKGEKVKIFVNLAGAGDKTLTGGTTNTYLIVKKVGGV